MSDKVYDVFTNTGDALALMESVLHLCQNLAEKHDIPFLAAYQPSRLWLHAFKHLPDETGSELKAAWYEIVPGEKAV